MILGGGTAALQAAKAIRLRNRTAEITMLSEEKELPYDRPMLTKNLFGAVSGGAIASVSAKWYQENRINLQLESRVAALDAEKKEVVLTDGTVYPFDKCIYALGAHSFVPPIKGNDLPQVAVVRSIADVERVNALVQDAKNAYRRRQVLVLRAWAGGGLGAASLRSGCYGSGKRTCADGRQD